MASAADLGAPLMAGFDAVLPAAGARLVVLVSGGADSVALLRLLDAARRWRLSVYHLDHGLRADSAADARWLASWCAQLGIECITERIELRALAQSQGANLEALGREERYRRAAAVARRLGADGLVTAHHRDDQAETVLMQLVRGAGATGARGLPALRACDGVALYRPLLACARAQLRAYLAGLGQDWREDGSNADVRLRRNAMRHEVLPLLEAAEPGFAQALVAWSQTREAARAGEAGREAYEQLVGHGLEPTRARVRRLQELAQGAVGRALRLGRWLVEAEAQGTSWQDLSSAAPPEPAAVVITGPATVSRAGEVVLLRAEPVPPPAALATAPGEAWLDAAAVRFPLHWRSVAAADAWQPLGAPGHQRVFKTLADRKLPRARRAAVGVIADEQGIVWIPGLGISQRVRVQAQTPSVLHGWWRALAPSLGTAAGQR